VKDRRFALARRHVALLTTIAGAGLLAAAAGAHPPATAPGSVASAPDRLSGAIPAAHEARASRNGLPRESYGFAERRQRPRYV
jgi:hypothetical protein